MRYAATILYVPDVAAAVGFYTEAFGLEPGFMPPGGGYATLAGDGGQLAFATRDGVAESVGEEARRPPAGFEVWIEATDVPGAVERAVAAGAELVLEPERKPWGQVVAYVRDPNGTLVEIGEPVADG
jgi:catechol 2,3-dioxygenase-like lactoylglutathione lyase family enzyme